ncbi:hypothetical protein HWV62_41852 [Athelia sp. TMB]|nr:hypothetical protein HWV62_41852 [Athelia sp. TMB]
MALMGGNLKDRIAALQQRSVSAPPNGQQNTPAASKAGVGNNAGPATGSLRSKIAKFESKGGVPIPRGSFGMGAPPEQVQGQSMSRELYGNRIGGVNKPSPSLSRSGSPLPGYDDPPSSASSPGKRRLSTGNYNGLPLVDLSGVTQKLSYQASLVASDGAYSEDSTPAVELPASDGAPTDVPRRNSLAALGAGRRAASSSELFTSSDPSPPLSSPAGAVPIPDEAAHGAQVPSPPAIVVSPDQSSSALDAVAKAPSVRNASIPKSIEEPIPITSAISLNDVPTKGERTVVKSSTPQTQSEIASPVADVSAAASEPIKPISTGRSTPVASPITPTTTGGRQALLEHPPDSPYLEFVASASAGTPPKPEIVIQRPVRTSSLGAKVTPRTRSPSPTPSMIRQSEGDVTAKTAVKLRKKKSASKARAFANVRRTMMELPANPPPAPDNEDEAASYGSVVLGSRSENNILDAVSNKPIFSAVVHQKITENSPSSVPEAPITQIAPKTPAVTHTLTANSSVVAPLSPGYGDLAALLEEAALLEAKLAAGEVASDIVDQIRGTDEFGLEPFSVEPSSTVPSIRRSATPESMDKEAQQQKSPSKGLPRMLSGIRRFTSSSTARSLNGSHSRISTSGSEVSSEDSASVNTPSENGLAFPSMHPNGSRQSMGSGLGVGYPNSPKKNRTTSRASSIADKIWRRSRNISNNSDNSNDIPSPQKPTPGMPANRANTVPKRGHHNRPTTQHLPVLPSIPSPMGTPHTQDRPVSWMSHSSTSSTNTTNTTSTISPGLFGEELFNAFPSVPQQVPQAFPGTSMPRASIGGHEVGRTATLPLRTRRHSAQRIN